VGGVLTPQRISGGERQALKALREISDAGANWLWGSRPYKELETKSDHPMPVQRRARKQAADSWVGRLLTRAALYWCFDLALNSQTKPKRKRPHSSLLLKADNGKSVHSQQKGKVISLKWETKWERFVFQCQTIKRFAQW